VYVFPIFPGTGMVIPEISGMPIPVPEMDSLIASTKKLQFTLHLDSNQVSLKPGGNILPK